MGLCVYVFILSSLFDDSLYLTNKNPNSQMVTLLAESKTMLSSELPVSENYYLLHKPVFESQADAIAAFMNTLPFKEIAARLSISDKLAAKDAMLFYSFPDKSKGLPALKAFTGDVFRAIDFMSLPEECMGFANAHILLVSSLYGLLRPSDVVKPYRLDFNVDCGPDGENISAFWRPKVTIELVKQIKERNDKEILNLLPAEASRLIDWKIVKAFARVIKPDFKVITEEGNLKTPQSGKLKELRGKMVREIIKNNVNNFSSLLKLESDYYFVDNDNSLRRPQIFIAKG